MSRCFLSLFLFSLSPSLSIFLMDTYTQTQAIRRRNRHTHTHSLTIYISPSQLRTYYSFASKLPYDESRQANRVREQERTLLSISRYSGTVHYERERENSHVNLVILFRSRSFDVAQRRLPTRTDTIVLSYVHLMIVQYLLPLCQ